MWPRCVCVCARARACVCPYARARVRACVRACVCACVRACASACVCVQTYKGSSLVVKKVFGPPIGGLIVGRAGLSLSVAVSLSPSLSLSLSLVSRLSDICVQGLGRHLH